MIFIGSDHGGFELKQELVNYIKEEFKTDVKDMGCYSTDSVDYPDIARQVCEMVISQKNSLGIVICGTGIGISMAANKIRGIRCALCTNEYTATMTRRHNDANVLALGGRVIGPELAKSIVKAFLNADFDGGRHQRRIEKIHNLENSSD